MDIHLAASGTPGQVTQDLAQQLKAARTDKPDGWAATLAGIRDDVARELQQQGSDNVQVDLHITLGVTSLTAGDALRTFVETGKAPPGIGAPETEFQRQNRGTGGAPAPAPSPQVGTGGSLGGASLEDAQKRRATDALRETTLAASKAPTPTPTPTETK